MNSKSFFVFLLLLLSGLPTILLAQRQQGKLAAKPLFRDPVYDGAADPIVIWNPQVSKWWMFYTNRRANQTELPGVSWVFGTPIGIAESADGANWNYLGTANFPDLPADCGGKDATLWAPDIVLGNDGKWHMYLSIVPGIDVKWGLPGFISHLTSTNLRDWKYESRLNQLGTSVIDSDILKMPDGTWRMYYKDQTNYSRINMTKSKDLFTWSDPKEALKINGEGPIAFQWKGYYWLIIDTWNGQTVHRSKDGDTWEVQPGSPLLPDDEGTGIDDIPNALHANVVLSNNRVYMYYFTHPGRTGENKKKDTYEQRRTSVQVVELELSKEGWITANRNAPTYVQLFQPLPMKASVSFDLNQTKTISNHLFDAFIEDINYSANGGLYAELARPTPQQLAFQDLELGVFIHYSIDVYADHGVPSGHTPASAFNPTELDVEQWVKAAKEMGATYVVLTARHEQGFCLWPTKTTDYSIKSSPYKNGKGDIVREFVDACRKHGLKAGLYTAPWIDAHWEANQPEIKGGDFGRIDKLDDPELYEKALKKEKEQIRELMTNYGSLVFIWDDHFGRSDALDSIQHGGKFREFYATVTKFAHELQPNCLFLGRDIEHVGTEEGRACYPFWNALNTVDGTNYSVSKTYHWNHCNTGEPLGKFYRPQLACTTDALSSGGWMWTGSRKPKPIERRMLAYYETIGRGSGLIVNLTPDRRGLIPEDLVAAAKEMGDEVNRRFSNPIAQSELQDKEQIIKLNGTKTIDHVVLMEDLSQGQKIASYSIEAEVNGIWKTVVTGQTIGHKRVDQFAPVTATVIRFKVTGSVAEGAVMRKIAVFTASI